MSQTANNSLLDRAVGAPAVSGAPQTRQVEVLKVSAQSRPNAVAGAIAGVIRDSGVAEVQSVGAGATNQAVKAIAIARSYLRDEAIELICTPSFTDVVIAGEERTAIRLLVERRPEGM
ncbi:MAG: stage V sporulation protein S [Chloroflexota bacterium]|nr:MAG: stage V sporulation protein S [Chloroflexota bacterium]